MRHFFIFSSLILFFGISKCDNGGPDIKIYISKPEKGGLIRFQENEFIPYKDTKDFRCLSKEDFDAFLNWCLAGDE